MDNLDALHDPQLADGPSFGFELPDFALSSFELPEADMIERIREGLRAHAASNAARPQPRPLAYAPAPIGA